MPAMPDSEHTTAAWVERTPSDLASLLVELGRAVRGFSFYGAGSVACDPLVDRAWRASRGELDRAGALELWLDEQGFRAVGVNEAVPLDHLRGLAEAFTRHGIDCVTLDQELTRDALHAFLELLGRGTEHAGGSGGLAHTPGDRCGTGISVSATGGRPAAVADDPVDGEHEDAHAGNQPGLGAAMENGDPASAPDPATPAVPVDAKATIDERPLEAASTDPRGERLRGRLVELDGCPDDDAYRFLAERVVSSAISLSESGLRGECHRAVLVLADHAVGGGGRSGLQARVAQRLCVELASDERLDALIERARAHETNVRVRAVQVLLQLGEHAIPALFDQLAAADDPDDAGQLTGTLVALGEAGVAHLEQVIGEPDDARAALAIRLAGELQHPVLAGSVARALEGDRDALLRDAARVLAQLGGDDALRALVNALSSERDELPEIAAHCLAELGDARAVQPLLAALERAGRRTSNGGSRARKIVRALGSLGSQRATPRLVALLERRSLLRRRSLRKLQLCALTALSELTGREAGRAVDRARRHRDPAIRERARTLFAEAFARPA